ncbi:MAG: hypothetical protein IM572_09340 [Chitinophagaceae bacterium]|nr:hypothetical protein [Microcystis sp. M065S1]MCA6445417.1 hypothetical protein [Bacteroidota bacterium]MCA6492867.1 hypothetical protein [Chitinophagaceae bacterium]
MTTDTVKVIKYALIFMGIVVIVLSIINSVYEKSIISNKWSFCSGILLIWFAVDKKLQKRFEEF